jgi:hypothetical protein
MYRPHPMLSPPFLRFKKELGLAFCEAIGIVKAIQLIAKDRGTKSFKDGLDIETVVEYQGEPGVLLPALIRAGYIEMVEGLPTVVEDTRGWDKRRPRKKQRQRRKVEAKQGRFFQSNRN